MISIEKRHSVALAIGFVYGACPILHVAPAHGAEEADELIAQIRRKYDEQQAVFAALTEAKEELKVRIVSGDKAAIDACAQALHELRTKPDSWWDDLPLYERQTENNVQSSLILALSSDRIIGTVPYMPDAWHSCLDRTQDRSSHPEGCGDSRCV